MKITKNQVCSAMAKSMQEFGYPDVDTKMAGEIMDAYIAGKREGDLPHGIIGMFLSRQLSELEENGVDLALLK